jgi:lysophospholipase L1-like esterase
VGAVHLALRTAGTSIAPGSDRAVTFGGTQSVRIPPGALAVSDPVALAVPDLAELAVSLELPGPIEAATVHDVAEATTHILPGQATTHSWYFLSGVEVWTPESAQAVVAFGDSLTDGLFSTPDANRRFTDFLAARLRGRGRAVVNEGISGNRLLADLGGDAALARLDRDALSQPGARYLLLFEGINDIGVDPPEDATAEQVIAGLRQILQRAHGQGLRVIGGTLLPYAGSEKLLLYSARGEERREAINRFIRAGGEYDGVIDFDRALRDPAQPSRLLPAFDSGDHLHPNDAGYEAMAAAADLSLFSDPR